MDPYIDRSKPRQGGINRPLVLGLIVLGALVLAVVITVAWMQIQQRNEAVNRVRQAAARAQSMNNLRMIFLGLQGYQDDHKKLPLPANFDPGTGKPLLSWRVHILPYLEHKPLYDQFRLNEPWDSPHNLPLAQKMPREFLAPNNTERPNDTTYQYVVGPKTLFPHWPAPGPEGKPANVRLYSIQDDRSHTFLVAESNKPVLWTKPADIEYDPLAPPPALGSLLPDYFLVCFADGSVRALRKNLNAELVRLLIDPADGQPIPFDALD
jgi:hypothetical protein